MCTEAFTEEFLKTCPYSKPYGEEQEIDCSRDPFDLRPAVDAIMRKANWILERLPPGQKLVIIMGEDHDFQTHIMLQQLVLAAHVRQAKEHSGRSFAFGYEGPHDYALKKTGYQTPGQSGPEGMRAFLDKPDSYSAEARATLFRYCLSENISCAFNDVSCDGAYLDVEDDYTRRLIEQHHDKLFGNTKNIHRICGPTGMAYSNLSMAEKTAEHIAQTGADIYILETGHHHMFGSISHNYWFQHSLSIKLLERGFAILPVTVNHEGVERHMNFDARRIFRTSGLGIKYTEYGREPSKFAALRDRIGAASRFDF